VLVMVMGMAMAMAMAMMMMMVMLMMGTMIIATMEEWCWRDGRCNSSPGREELHRVREEENSAQPIRGGYLA
jgi:Na+-transporting methylmalonyl-CoA/oxaloacetate decarboxylase gamma subunit